MTRGGIIRHRSTIWLMLAVVLLLRAAVPQGFMPERAENGSIALVVCGSGGVVHIPFDKDVPRKPSAPSHCAFAGMGAPADLPPAFELAEILWSAEAFAAPEPAAQATARLYPRPPSRGPPARA